MLAFFFMKKITIFHVVIFFIRIVILLFRHTRFKVLCFANGEGYRYTAKLVLKIGGRLYNVGIPVHNNMDSLVKTIFALDLVCGRS